MDISVVEQLVKILNDSEAVELTVTSGEVSMSMRRGQGPVPEEPYEADAHGEAAEEEAAPRNVVTPVTARMVGIFHPAEGLEQGSAVQKNQVIGLIESMKLMNEMTAPLTGLIVDIHVEDGMPVEYGQHLLSIEETA